MVAASANLEHQIRCGKENKTHLSKTMLHIILDIYACMMYMCSKLEKKRKKKENLTPESLCIAEGHTKFDSYVNQDHQFC